MQCGPTCHWQTYYTIDSILFGIDSFVVYPRSNGSTVSSAHRNTETDNWLCIAWKRCSGRCKDWFWKNTVLSHSREYPIVFCINAILQADMNADAMCIHQAIDGMSLPFTHLGFISRYWNVCVDSNGWPGGPHHLPDTRAGLSDLRSTP